MPFRIGRWMCVGGFLLTFAVGISQERQNYADFWLASNIRMKIGMHWSVSNEIHIRRTHFLKHWEQFIVRPSVRYQLSEQLNFSLGYSYIRTYPFSENMKPFPIQENNIWEQILIQHKIERVQFKHRIRFEQRFTEHFDEDSLHQFTRDGVNFSNRIRYRIILKVPFAKQFFFKTFDEIMIRMNSKFQNMTYDRNWVYAGFGWSFSKQSSLNLGYLFQFIKVNPNLIQLHHTLVIGIQYTFQILKSQKN
ncbi:MAG: DUF2490 domain-containing protein [Crocinitomicaceae bacterium]